jgi:hypothetical protein
MKIFVNDTNLAIGHQILDGWHAYRQSCSDHYLFDAEYQVEKHNHLSDCDLKIYCDYMAYTVDSDIVGKYNLILICNGGEPIEVALPAMKTLLKNQNVYLLTNAFLDTTHPLKHKNLWYPSDIYLCRDYWTKQFYPQYFENQKLKNLKRKNKLAVITGSNRPNRQYFFELLKKEIPELEIRATINVDILEALNDCQWESAEDLEFREWLNSYYPVNRNSNNSENYYSRSISVGIKNKFGSIPPGYFILPLYFESHCVIFPESNWVNNELCITEKSLKCFYSGSLPMPVAGANTNKLYNQLGFFTAWNLLPAEHQEFDSELDHRSRYAKLVKAIQWLNQNPAVFESAQFSDFAQQNKMNFLTGHCDRTVISDFDLAVSKHVS